MKISRLVISFLFTATFITSYSISVFAGSDLTKASSIAMNGSAKYPDGFTHFDYVNSDAPKGGSVRLNSIGTYDSFNGFISKGVSADGLGMIYETLTTGSSDEAFTEYGLIADEIEYPEDRTWVIYHLNPKAKFHDGEPSRLKT
jgi:microcin C transport system substrate-binding protein